MALVLSGAASSYFYRTTNLGASSKTFQKLFCFKRTGAQTGNRFLMTMRNADHSSGHDVVINNEGLGSTYAPALLANYASAAGPLDVLTLDEWWWIAVGATNGVYNIRSGVHGATALTSDSVDDSADAAFTMALIHFGAAAGTQPVAGKFAYIFEANEEWTEEQILAQMASATPLLDVISFKSGLGSNLTDALTGSVGAAFTAGSGGVSLDSDAPTFGPVLSGTIQLPESQTIELVAPTIVSVTASGTNAIVTAGNIDPSATTLHVRRAPSLANGQPDTGNMTLTSSTITPGESSAGLKSVSISGHSPGQTYHYYAWVSTGSTVSDATGWSSLTFDTLVVLTGSEGPDVGTLQISQDIAVELEGFEQGDFAEDLTGPEVTIFAPSSVTTAGTYPVTISAIDLTGVESMVLYRDGVEIASYTGGGPYTYTETASFAENGTRAYHVVATDLGGNETTTAPQTTTIAILQGEFSVDLEASATTVTEPGSIELTVTVDDGVSVANIVILILQNGSQLGQAITQAPFTKAVQYLSSSANGTFQYQAKATLSDGSVGYSNIVAVTVNIPADEGGVLVISTGMADMIEIPRRDTSRALMFRLTDTDGTALTGLSPTVQIAKDNGAYETPTGVVAEMSVAGLYAYWPSAEDVNDDGPLSVSITAPGTGAAPVPPIHCRVVTPYGKR